MKHALFLVCLGPLALLCGCSAEKPVYDPPKVIKRYTERDTLLLAIDSTLVSTYDKEVFKASFATLRNPFIDYKDPVVEVVKEGPKVPVKPKELTLEEIFAEAIDLLGPKSVLISPNARILVTSEGSRREGFVIEWTDPNGREFKATLVEITSNSFTLDYKGTKQRFPLRR